MLKDSNGSARRSITATILRVSEYVKAVYVGLDRDASIFGIMRLSKLGANERGAMVATGAKQHG
jgi:hypothetical protein